MRKKIKFSEFPKAIEIQTASYCNSGCVICPYNSVKKTLPVGVMKESLFKKIIDEIGRKKIKIIPYFNNEPFLDPDIIKKIKLINKNCPNAEVELSTNLSLLDGKKQMELLKIRINDLRLSIFGFSKKTHKAAMPGLDWNIVYNNLKTLAKNKKLRKKIKIIRLVMVDYPGLDKKDIAKAKKFCEKNNIKFEFWGFLDRAGNVVSYSNDFLNKYAKGCEQNRPLQRMHVTFTGDVVLCCMDWKWEYKIGNLKKSSIKKIWISKKYDNLRKEIYSGDGNAPELCKKCKLSL